MTIAQFTILELATASVTIAGGIALILRQIQHSRCRTCNFCWCINCEREVPNIEEPDVELGEQNNAVNHQN